MRAIRDDLTLAERFAELVRRVKGEKKGYKLAVWPRRVKLEDFRIREP